MCDNKKVDLKIDWATHKAAEYACKHWHYSKCIPTGKMIKIGAWENNIFISVIIFSYGASSRLLDKYKLKQYQGCELTRIAFKKHECMITEIIKVSISFLKKSNPKLKLIVSFADPLQDHIGIIYQAGNWIYDGLGYSAFSLKINGKIYHRRSVFPKFGTASIKKLPKGFEKIKTPGKYRYLMPLTKEMRKKILPLSKPYPKKADEAGDGPYQGNSGSATLTRPLQ